MSKKGLGKFLTGAAIGAGIALLFAPKKGSETREDIKNKTGELVDKIKNTDKDEVKKILEKKLKELKNDLKNLDKESAKEIIKEKADMIIAKADELIEVAKEKSAPVIEKATKEIKNKTINILESAIEKLEDEPVVEKKQIKSRKKTTNKKVA